MGAMNPPSPVEIARFQRQIAGNNEGCWVFTGPDVTSDGYVRWRSGPGKPRTMVHVWSYTVYNGPIPEGMQVGHACHDRAVEDGSCPGGPGCRHRRCCNPAHLEAQTPSQNTTVQNHAARARTHCPKGHPYDEENTLIGKDGKRRCRACRRKS